MSSALSGVLVSGTVVFLVSAISVGTVVSVESVSVGVGLGELSLPHAETADRNKAIENQAMVCR